MNIQPIGNRILVKPLEAETKTKSGLYIPESAKEKPLMAKVIAVGDGTTKEGKVVTIPVKVGDKVIHESYGGTEVKLEGEKHLILDMKDVLAIVKGE